MKKTTILLPNNPSDLIELALRDLTAVEKMKGYKIDMNKYHQPNGKCAVCFAGAVMVRSLGAVKRHNLYPSDFGPDETKLAALDSFRLGHVATGVSIMRTGRGSGSSGGVVTFENPLLARTAYGNLAAYVPVPGYTQRTRKKFHQAMADMARNLRALGL